jgi:hypothetical protein
MDVFALVSDDSNVLFGPRNCDVGCRSQNAVAMELVRDEVSGKVTSELIDCSITGMLLFYSVLYLHSSRDLDKSIYTPCYVKFHLIWMAQKTG